MSYFDHLDNYQENIALITNNEKINYKELILYSGEISKKVKERSLVILICENSLEAIAGYIGFIKSNCVVLLFDNRLAKSDFQKLVQSYQPNYIFLTKNKFSCKISYESIFNFRNYELLKKKEYKKHNLNKELALLMSTSGSMGASKFVRQSYENIVCNIQQINNFLKIKPSDCTITTMPMNYTYGLSIIHTHLYNGACIALSEGGLMTKQFWHLFEKYKVTNFGGVPYVYEILKKLDFKRKYFKNLKYITQAGGKLSKDLSLEFVEICKKKKLRMIFMYGQTEATARMSYLPWELAKKKLGSIGKPVSGGRFWLKDSQDKPIKQNDKIGELVYEGKNVSLGYSINSKDLIKGNDNKGILFTGDLAKRDKDDFYYIMGRTNRLLKIFGTRINLDDVENLIREWGYNCVCTGNDNEIKIFLLKKFDRDLLIEKISNSIGIHKSAINLMLIDEIPRNKAGKILYSELS